MKIVPLTTLAILSLTAVPALAQPMPGQRISRSDPNGTYCREYQQTVMIDGVRQKAYGTSCQQPDGSWKILPSDVAEETSDDTVVEYLEPPRYTTAPVYMVPPPVYYEPVPTPVYYYDRYPSYPYYGYGSYGSYSSFNIDFGGGHGHHGGHHGHGHW